MITIIIFIIVCTALMVYGNFKYSEGDEWFGASVAGVMLGAIIGLIVALCLPQKTKIFEYSAEIECINDGGSIKGRFFLGSGNIDGTMMYNFYYKTTKGSYKLMQIDVDDASIYYIDENSKNVKPYFKFFQSEKVKGAFINYFSLRPIRGINNYEIYIPKGSIKTDFVLDAE